MKKNDLLIIYGSQTGNAEMVAQDVFVAAQAFDIQVQCLGMEQASPALIQASRDVLVVISTCGEGDMPDNAHALWQALHGAAAPDLAGVHFAVLALGDSLYDHFCRAGKAFDAHLHALGAIRLRERVDCDAEFAEDAARWTREILARLAQLRAYAGRKAPPAPVRAEPGYRRDEPLLATLTARRTLTKTGAVREVLHCELDLGQEVRWQPGALLYLWPENDAQPVADIIEALGARAADQVFWRGRRERLDTLLTRDVELRHAPAPLLAALGIAVPAHGDAAGDVADALRARPLPDAQDVLEYLQPMQPRAYSVANAQTGDNTVHLTVSRIVYTRGGRRYHGAATHFLHQLPVGGQVRCHLARNRHFTIPQDAGRDLIMIAAGSGIAPFRAFMQARVLQSAPGRNWLFFGNRARHLDFLYEEEWMRWQQSGMLHRLSTAFSRDGSRKTYVQDLMREHGGEIFACLENGAFLMVCGSAEPMAREVEATLREVIEKHGNMRAANADAYIATLKNDKRYVRDVY